MTASTTAPAGAALNPLGLQNRPLAWKIGAVILGTVLLAAASYIEVPMFPVPVTLQTFAVALVGALYGWRLGGITISAWLIEGASGLPVLAGGAAGAHHFVGPTAGYLFAFPVAGMIMGWLAERGWTGQRVGLAFVAMLTANLVCLTVGAAWLTTLVGAEQAIVAGVMPFLLGAVLKSALGAMVLKLICGRMTRKGG
ncbi:biotin transporter BioY [Rhodovulum sulfidophilum]|uniref:biotin transporter BioY n=1 Tax=Rhodovulum sulfidophilum TaxID=35806 RepID=UPI001F38DC0F|nr:biotin transporter BioY [Rhodovulum sulfidophilum]MCE8438439.1 biotin transporter BioY [Rhodovulum sulfidophilum]